MGWGYEVSPTLIFNFSSLRYFCGPKTKCRYTLIKMTTFLSFLSGTGSLQYTSVFANDLNTNFLSLREFKADTLTIDNINGINNGLYVRATSAAMSGDNITLSAQNIYLVGTVETISTDNYKIADPVIQLNSGGATVSGGIILASGTTLEYGRIQAVVSGANYGMQFTTGISTGVISTGYTLAHNVTTTSAVFNTISCNSAAICDLNVISGGVRISDGIIGFHTGSSVPGVTMQLSDDLFYISCVSAPVVIGAMSTNKLEVNGLILSSANYGGMTTSDIGYSFGTGPVVVSVTGVFGVFLSTFATVTVPAGVWAITVYGNCYHTAISDSGATSGLLGIYGLLEQDITGNPNSLPIGRRAHVVNFCRGISMGIDGYCSYVSNLSQAVTYYLRATCWTGANSGSSATFSARADFTKIA